MTRRDMLSFDRDAAWIALFTIYYAAYWVLRTMFGLSLGLDEAQLPLEAGIWRLGYGVNLPLYTWLQNGLFALMGPSIAAMALLKSLMLGATTLGLYGLARLAAGPALAGAATVMLYTQPQFGWEAHRALTHSATAALAVVAIVLAWVRLDRAPSPGRYALFGAAIGFGLLTKYNVWLFVPAWVAAGTLGRGRRSLREGRGRWLAPAVAAAIFAAPLAWMMANMPRASGSVAKFDMATGVASRLAGIADLGLALLSLAGLPALFLGLAWVLGRRGRATVTRDRTERDALRLFLLSGAAIVALALAGVLVTGAETVRERWLYPVLAPAFLAAFVAAGARMGPRGVAAMRGAGAFAMALILAGLPVYNTAGDAKRSAPFAAAVGDLAAAGAGASAHVVSPDTWVAGNLAHLRPDWVVNDLRFLRGAPAPGNRFLMVVEGTRGTLSEAVAALPFDAGPCPNGENMQIEHPYPRSDEATLRLSAAWICR